jgi:hypothetical protein
MNNPSDSFVCTSCGELHEELSRAIPQVWPTCVSAIAAEERPQRVWLSDYFCIVDDDKFFQYGSLEIPIIGHKEQFIWGVWVQLAEKDFALAEDLVGVEGRENEQPFLARTVGETVRSGEVVTQEVIAERERESAACQKEIEFQRWLVRVLVSRELATRTELTLDKLLERK